VRHDVFRLLQGGGSRGVEKGVLQGWRPNGYSLLALSVLKALGETAYEPKTDASGDIDRLISDLGSFQSDDLVRVVTCLRLNVRDAAISKDRLVECHLKPFFGRAPLAHQYRAFVQ